MLIDFPMVWFVLVMKYNNFKYGVHNLWKWRKVIWNDRDWHNKYLYAILEKKFDEMHKVHLNSRHPSTNTKVAIDTLSNARDHARLLKEDKYDIIALRQLGEGKTMAEYSKKEEMLRRQALIRLLSIIRDYDQEWWD